MAPDRVETRRRPAVRCLRLLIVLLLGPGAEAVVALPAVGRVLVRQRAMLSAARMQSDTPPPPIPGEEAASGSDAKGKRVMSTIEGMGELPDLTGLDFEERLKVMAKFYENATPIDPKEREQMDKDEFERRDWDEDEKFWRPDFWKLVGRDLQETEWPSLKKVWQTFLVSQVAFIAVIIITLLFDAFCDATIRSIVLGDEWTYTMDRILKVANQPGPM